MENVSYRYNLYKKDGIDLHLVVYSIEESPKSTRISDMLERQGIKDLFEESAVETVDELNGIQSPKDGILRYVKSEEKLYQYRSVTNTWTPVSNADIGIREVATKSDLENITQEETELLKVHVLDEDIWYQYVPVIKKWKMLNAYSFLYNAKFYIQYSNEKDQTGIRAYFRMMDPCWKSIEDAKAALQDLHFTTIDMTVENGYVFYIIDEQNSRLLDEDASVQYLYHCITSGSGRMPMTIARTSLIPCSSGAVAYVINCKVISHNVDITQHNKQIAPSNVGYSFQHYAEGVQKNVGNSRLLFLLNRWNRLEKDFSQYLLLSDAVISDGYAKIT